MQKRSKNARVLAALLDRQAAGAAPAKPCRFFAAGLCPRLLLFGTPWSLGRCRFEHPPTAPAPATAAMKWELLQHIAAVLRRAPQRPLPAGPSIAEYLRLRRCLAIHQANQTELVPLYTEKVWRLELEHERRGVPPLPCPVCPGALPWAAAKKKEHLLSKAHLGYKALREMKDKIFYELL